MNRANGSQYFIFFILNIDGVFSMFSWELTLIKLHLAV